MTLVVRTETRELSLPVDRPPTVVVVDSTVILEPVLQVVTVTVQTHEVFVEEP